MEKIPTIFARDEKNPRLVTRTPTPGCEWVFEGLGTPTWKRDGTNVQVEIVTDSTCPGASKVSRFWKRKNPTREEKAQGLEPSYILADQNDPNDKHLWAALHNACPGGQPIWNWPEGIYQCEALGPKIQGGIESRVPELFPFRWISTVREAGGLCLLEPSIVLSECERTYEGIRDFLTGRPIEGIVWHASDGRMAKLKRRDFSLEWPADFCYFK